MPEQEEKFGQVFITFPENGKGDQPVDSCFFSNFDFRLYSRDGELHDSFRDLQSYNFSVGLWKEKEAKFQLKLKVPLPFKDIASPSRDLLQELNKSEINLFQKLNFISNSETDANLKFIRERKISSLFAFMTSKTDLLEQSNFLLKVYPFAFLNFLGEQLTSVTSLKPILSYELSMDLNDKLIECLTGARNAGGCDLNLYKIATNVPFRNLFQLQNMFSQFKKLLREVGDEAVTFGGELEVQPFFQAFADCLEAQAMQACSELKKSEGVLNEVQKELRKWTTGWILICEGIALQKGVFLSERVRNNFVFKKYREEVASYFQMLNELVFSSQEMLWGDLGQDVNGSLRKIQDLEQFLVALFGMEMKEYVEIVNDMMCGYVQWMAYCQNDDHFQFDCYVEDKS